MQNLLLKFLSPLFIFLASLNPFKTAPVINVVEPVAEVISSPSPTSSPQMSTAPTPSVAASAKPSLIPSPTPSPSPSLEPSQTPQPTADPPRVEKPNYVDTRRLTFAAAGNGEITNRTGWVQMNVTSIGSGNATDSSYRTFNFTWDGYLSGLKPYTAYTLQLCLRSGSCLGYSTASVIQTDLNGNATFQMPVPGTNYGGIAYTVQKDNPIWSVIIIEPGDTDTSDMTLKADYNLSIGF